MHLLALALDGDQDNGEVDGVLMETVVGTPPTIIFPMGYASGTINLAENSEMTKTVRLVPSQEEVEEEVVVVGCSHRQWVCRCQFHFLHQSRRRRLVSVCLVQGLGMVCFIIPILTIIITTIIHTTSTTVIIIITRILIKIMVGIVLVAAVVVAGVEMGVVPEVNLATTMRPQTTAATQETDKGDQLVEATAADHSVKTGI